MEEKVKIISYVILTTKVVTTPYVYTVDSIFPTFHVSWDVGFRNKECTWPTKNGISCL